MGVYIFKSKHIDAIKIGYTSHSSPWKRVYSKGFYSCLCPLEIKTKVGVYDIELLAWYPNRNKYDEKSYHYLLYEYNICGEWFKLEAFTKLITHIKDTNDIEKLTKTFVNHIYANNMGTIDNPYPSNVGKPWEDDEIVQLLKEVQRKLTIDEIAIIHKRTFGGIRSRLRELAADYHFNDGRPIEQIIKFTGLSESDIKDAIEKRTTKLKYLEERQKQKEEGQIKREEIIRQHSPPNSAKDIQSQILDTLLDIKNLLLEMNAKMKKE